MKNSIEDKIRNTFYLDLRLQSLHNKWYSKVSRKHPRRFHSWSSSGASEALRAVRARHFFIGLLLIIALQCNVNKCVNSIFTSERGYPLESCLMTPYQQPRGHKKNYNNQHSRVRNLIKRTYGSIKNKFQFMLKDRVLHYKPYKAARIVNACVVVHNMQIGDEEETPTNFTAIPLDVWCKCIF